MTVWVRTSSLLALLAVSVLTSDTTAGLSLPGRLLSRRGVCFRGSGVGADGASNTGWRRVAAPPDSDGRDDDFLMGLALEEARRAAEGGEVPIGAIVVRPTEGSIPDTPRRSFFLRRTGKDELIEGGSGDGGPPTTYYEVLSSAHNLVETTHDASAHAELLSLRSAAAATANWRLLNCTLYSTLEPCPMCLSAAQAFRIDRVVYGAPDLRLGAVESYMTMLEENIHPYHGGMEVEGGILGERSAEMMREFFRKRRKERQEEKRREKLLVATETPAVSTAPHGWQYLRAIGKWARKIVRRN